MKYNCRSLFLDSGAFSLLSANMSAKKFWKYVDSYARFIKRNKEGIDYYANVDVIGSPEKSWDVLKYLEKKGLHPVPVIHYGASMEWVDRYIDEGYTYIGLGGMARIRQPHSWLDRVFSKVCNPMPQVKLHGFAITRHDLMINYPWYSVDSVSWALVGMMSIIVPHKRNGKFVFDEAPYILRVSDQSPNGFCLQGRSAMERNIIHEWLSVIGIPLGNDNKKGIVNNFQVRALANLKYYTKLQASLPKYPWSFGKRVRETL